MKEKNIVINGWLYKSKYVTMAHCLAKYKENIPEYDIDDEYIKDILGAYEGRKIKLTVEILEEEEEEEE